MKKILSITISLFLITSIIIAAGIYFKIDRLDIFKKRISIEKLVKYFPFSKDSELEEWKEKILKGKVAYEVETDDKLSYVRADSAKAASALFYKLKLSIKKKPIIRWKWRVDKFPVRKLPETIEGKKEEDFAARVYVMFPAAFFTNSKVIEYIWAETLPVGTSGESGYSKKIKIVVLQSGSTDQWQSEKRNVYEDYVKLFGKEPRLDVGAIAFMTDSDSTKTAANAVYDEIEVSYGK